MRLDRAYHVRMCVGCAMLAASAATGFRTWLQTHHLGWLSPARLKALTVGAMCAAALVSSVGVSGSSTAVPTHAQVVTGGHVAAGTH